MTRKKSWRARGPSRSSFRTASRYLLRKNKVTVFDGEARLAGKGKLAVSKNGNAVADLAAPHIVLATGARARSLPGLEPDGKLVWTYKEAMVPEAIPKSLLVVGSGAIGIEFASFYRDMGAEVTVVEVLDRVLPVEDEEISAFARKSFEKQGIKIHTGATVKGLDRGRDSVTAHIEGGGKAFDVTAERVILAVGIIGNVEGIGLEGTGVKVERQPHRRRRMAAHRRGRHLCDRRCRRPALAGAQGEPRGGDLRREDRRGQRRASARSAQHPGLHLLPAAGGERRADRKGGARGRLRGQGRALPVYRQRQGDRARRARGHGQDRVRRQDRRTAWARTWSAPKSPS